MTNNQCLSCKWIVDICFNKSIKGLMDELKPLILLKVGLKQEK